MATYNVAVSINVEAKDVEDAARQAYRSLWAEFPTALVVTSTSGETSTIALPQSELSHLRSEAVEDRIRTIEAGNSPRPRI